MLSIENISALCQKYIVAIGVAEGNPPQKARASGSGVLLFVGGRKYLLTAQHVVNEMLERSDGYREPIAYMADNSKMAAFDLPVERREIVPDRALVLLEEDQFNLPTGKRFLAIANEKEIHQPQRGDYLYFLGFPHQLRRIREGRPDIDTPLVIVPIVVSKIEDSTRIWAMRLGGAYRNGTGGGPPLHYRGMSGGAVFHLVDRQPTLVGVATQATNDLGFLEVTLVDNCFLAGTF